MNKSSEILNSIKNFVESIGQALTPSPLQPAPIYPAILTQYKWGEQNNAKKLRLKQKEFEKDITIFEIQVNLGEDLIIKISKLEHDLNRAKKEIKKKSKREVGI
uniref:Uncharacterized protein n=1 Tax=Acrobeloides nanus TaxID=290746 RepID=A0A914CN34_9BILA